MRTKWRPLLIACIMTLMMALAVGCGGTGPTDKPEPQPSGSPYGELCIEDVTVWIGSNTNNSATFAQIDPIFTKPDKAEALVYTYDTSALKIEDNIVTPLKRSEETLNVRAKSEHFNTVFQVNVKLAKMTGEGRLDQYNVNAFNYAGQANACKAVTENTTLLLGDGFMDDKFIKDYMSTYAAGKDVINAGVDETTSWHWETFFPQIIGKTAPKNIVFHIGANNFYKAPRDSVEDAEESLTRLMMFLHTAYPSSNIYWFNITQRSDTAYSTQVDETNAYMANWCARYDWITCVDTASKVTTGMLKDGVHPETENYKVFTDALVAAGCEIMTKE